MSQVKWTLNEFVFKSQSTVNNDFDKISRGLNLADRRETSDILYKIFLRETQISWGQSLADLPKCSQIHEN